MALCKLCQTEILEPDGGRHRDWCDSVRRLLQLGTVRPEEYHETCFIEALFSGFGAVRGPRSGAGRGGKRLDLRGGTSPKASIGPPRVAHVST